TAFASPPSRDATPMLQNKYKVTKPCWLGTARSLSFVLCENNNNQTAAGSPNQNSSQLGRIHEGNQEETFACRADPGAGSREDDPPGGDFRSGRNVSFGRGPCPNPGRKHRGIGQR